MKIESARELKQELLSGLIGPVTTAIQAAARPRGRVASEIAELAGSTTFAVGARAMDSVPRLPRSIALGIAPHGGEYRLAVRVQRPGLLSSPLVDGIVKAAAGEADVRMIGRVEKRRGTRRRSATKAVQPAAPPWHRDRLRPLLIGGSVGHFEITAGTIGGFAGRGGRTFILSNNHVLANEDDASPGDAILQPGPADDGVDPDDRVAALRFFVRLRANGINFVDAALAALDPKIQFDASMLRGIDSSDRALAGTAADMADAGDAVFKVGRTTGATRGRVTAFDMDNVIVAYSKGNLRFDDQIEIESAGATPFSDGGDSGSLIVNDRFEAVALLFAGSDTGGSNGLGLTYANPIRTVLTELKADLLH